MTTSNTDWKDETNWYRESSGKRRLMCSTCTTEVFGGICECMPEIATKLNLKPLKEKI